MNEFTRIEGTIHNADGTSHEFQLTSDGFSQWGADYPHQEASWDLLKEIEEAARGFLTDSYE